MVAELGLASAVVVPLLYGVIGPQVTDVSEKQSQSLRECMFCIKIVLGPLSPRHMKTISVYQAAGEQPCLFSNTEVRVM